MQNRAKAPSPSYQALGSIEDDPVAQIPARFEPCEKVTDQQSSKSLIPLDEVQLYAPAFRAGKGKALRPVLKGHLVRGPAPGGSNPLAPTNFFNNLEAVDGRTADPVKLRLPPRRLLLPTDPPILAPHSLRSGSRRLTGRAKRDNTLTPTRD